MNIDIEAIKEELISVPQFESDGSFRCELFKTLSETDAKKIQKKLKEKLTSFARIIEEDGKDFTEEWCIDSILSHNAWGGWVIEIEGSVKRI